METERNNSSLETKTRLLQRPVPLAVRWWCWFGLSETRLCVDHRDDQLQKALFLTVSVSLCWHDSSTLRISSRMSNVPPEFVSLWHKDIERNPDGWKLRDFWGQLDADLKTSQQKHSHTQVLAVAQQHAANVCLLTTWAAERRALVELCFLSELTLQKRNCWKWKCFKATAAERSTTYCCTQRQKQFDDIFWPHHKKNSRILNSGVRLALFLMKWWIPFSFLTQKHKNRVFLDQRFTVTLESLGGEITRIQLKVR